MLQHVSGEHVIRKRSALLLSLFGFIGGVAFAQYKRRQLDNSLSYKAGKTLWEEKPARAVPMQMVDESMAAARKQRKKPDYTTH